MNGDHFAGSAVSSAQPKQTARGAVEDGGPDRAREIMSTLEREPGDRLTCVRVFGEFYRCNWWSTGVGPADPPMIRGLEVSTYRVRKSRLVKVTVADGHVRVEDATRAPSE